MYARGADAIILDTAIQGRQGGRPAIKSSPTSQKRKELVFEIERRLPEDAATDHLLPAFCRLLAAAVQKDAL